MEAVPVLVLIHQPNTRASGRCDDTFGAHAGVPGTRECVNAGRSVTGTHIRRLEEGFAMPRDV